MFKRMCPNKLLKDAINNRSIRTPAMRFSHDRSSISTGDANGDDKPNEDNSLISATEKSDGANEKIPTPPNSCCMSGCANCVWIQYADELTSKMRNGTDIARDIIKNEVQDPNMRSFLEMELRMLETKKDPK